MSSTIPKELTDILSVERIIVGPISTLSAMYCVYGLYILLFGAAVYLMRSRQRGDESKFNCKFYLSLTVILFVLCTMFVVDYTIQNLLEPVIFFTAVKTGDFKPFMDYAKNSVVKLTIYSFDQLVAVLLKDTSIKSNYMLVTHAKTVLASYDVCSAVVNSALTLFTAGRIWWIHRQARAHGVYSSDAFDIESIYRIILESGLIYPVFIVASLVATNTSTPKTLPFDFYPLRSLSAGIAPTLIIVRVKFGQNAENLQDRMISDIGFTTPREGNTIRSLGQVYSIGNFSMTPVGSGGGSEDSGVGIQKEATV
ncbi:hypothetical protein Moror_3796 [Moniliophthora roreri MCA 2997]|uniref:Uncharacterized protein n=1 Tax=Moniliophthora roreri (strain MCA 2997) TaxID=1381753 RepID=V2WRS2_MONRO|nr:hypothetical protein Moror_3796 [Moniliophthora roreri MCA 2997]